MKITNEAVIKSGEQELIDGITADLDWDAVEGIFQEQHRLPLGEDVSFRSGDLVVHENHIAYLLEFEVKVPLCMLVDREGNCVGIRAAGSREDGGMEAQGSPSEMPATTEEMRAGQEDGHEESDPEQDPDSNGDAITQSLSEARAELADINEPAPE